MRSGWRPTLRGQLLLAFIAVIVTAVVLSALVGTASLTERYVGHMRMQRMLGYDSQEIPIQEAPAPGPRRPYMSMPGVESTLSEPPLGWLDALRRAWLSIFGSPAATVGLGLSPGEYRLLRSLNLGLLAAGGIAVALAIILSLVLSSRLSHPLAALTATAREIETGNLEARVPFAAIRRAPEEVVALAEAVNQLAIGLTDAERQRHNLIAGVAHELRTPVTAIRSLAEAVRDGVLPGDRDAWETVAGETMRLGRLINDLLELSLWESGQMKLHRGQVDVGELLQQLILAYKAAAQEKQIDIAAKISLPNDVRWIWADRERLSQVLHNLLSNAMRHTPERGKIEIAVRPATADTRLRDAIEFVVSNTGPGIPPANLPHLFERFYRGDPSRSRATGGVGLGLTIAKQIVEAHGGYIWAESNPPEPTRFVFRLPLTREDGNESLEAESQRD